MKTVVRSVFIPVIERKDILNRTIKFVGTVESSDRSGDVISIEGWELDNFAKNPVFLWEHTPSLGPIGKVLSIVREGSSLIFEVKFAGPEVSEFADRIFKLFEAGFLNAVSVGFIAKEIEPIVGPDGELAGIFFKRQELLELSAVSIPAHQDALAASAFGKAMDESADYIKQHAGPKEHEYEEIMTLEQFSKTALAKLKPEATEEDDEIMKEQLEALTKEVAELQATVKGLLDLKETVDLSKTAMTTLNCLFAEKLSKNDGDDAVLKSGVNEEGQPPAPSFDPNALTGALTSLLEKVQSKSKAEANFKTQGDK